MLAWARKLGAWRCGAVEHGQAGRVRVRSGRSKGMGQKRNAGDARLTWRLLRPYRGPLLVALALLLAQSAAALAMPWLAGRFSAALLNGQPVTALLLAWFAVIALQ